MAVSDSGQAGALPSLPLIVVTPEMVAAGREELADHSLAGDLDYMLESVFRAMAYAGSLEASSISVVK